MASSVAEINFSCGNLYEKVYALPLRPSEDVMVRLQVAVRTVDADMLRRVRENIVRRIIICLEMDGGRFEHLLLLRGAHGLII
jgi:hypothetical protein